MHLGLVTYNLAQDWDLPTLLERCEETGFQGVELRTTHAHGVEPDMSDEAKQKAQELFGSTGVQLWCLGTTCEFHSADPDIVRQNIETCAEFSYLAHDLGAMGVKVRPNGLPEGIPEQKTLEQIAQSLQECGETAVGYGVNIFLEVHGRETSEPRRIKRIMDMVDAENVQVCWNSNGTDKDDTGSIRRAFELLADRIGSVHINELWREDYPWKELFGLLYQHDFQGYTLAEIPESSDPVRLMRYYRRLWMELSH